MMDGMGDGRLKLSEMTGHGRLDVLRDGSFSNLGFLSDPQPGMLTFVEDERFLAIALRTADIAAVLTTARFSEALAAVPGLALTEAPREAFFQIHNALAKDAEFYAKDFSADVDPSAAVHPRAYVAERNVRIGGGTRIGAGAVILEGSVIGEGVTIQAGVVIGASGFQVVRLDGRVVDVEHAGGVVIGDGATMMSNAVIARAVFRQSTSIGEYVRVGNLAYVSHNVTIGPRSVVGHGVTINGNVRIGTDSIIGPGATIANGISIGDRAQISLGAVVISDVEADRRVSGNFAIEHRRLLRQLARRR
jgi:UDP-3-O-[3-hydroxymyristoyl] glucosamine N-acyltransferase